MRDLCRLIGWTVVDLLRSRAMLEAEIWTLRQQINVLRRAAPKKLSFSTIDRLIFVGLHRLFPKVCDALAIVKPDTIVRWHRAGFRSYWRWKSRPFDIGQASVVKYMVRRRRPPSQGWKTFLRNHADGIAAMDLFVVPTI